MSSGNVGQDELIEILENLFKAMDKKRATARQRRKSNDKDKSDSQKRQEQKTGDSINTELTSSKDSSESKKDLALPEDRLSKEEALTYLQAYTDHVDLEVYEFKNNFIDDKRVSINFKEKSKDTNASWYSLKFDLETNKGSIENSYYGERKGSFQTIDDIEKVFSKEELIQKYNELNLDKKREAIKKNVGEKVSLVDSMTNYAKNLDLKGYHLSSKSVTENKAMLFFKHKENAGDVKEISYNPKTETGKVTHLLSNKENNYANKKTVLNEFDKADLERYGFGKTPEQIALENENKRVDTEDTREETEITYNQKVLDSKLGKSITKQVLASPELLKGAVALYQLSSMKKLLSNSKDQLENLNTLLNKKDANFEKINEIKDSLSLQIDALQGKVSDLEKNQETTKTYEKLNEGFQKDQDDQYEKSRENTPTKVVEVEHSR